MSLGSGIRDPGSGINLFRTPGSKGTQSRIPDPKPVSFVSVFGSGIRDPGSGMGKHQDPGSGINIPDPQQ